MGGCVAKLRTDKEVSEKRNLQHLPNDEVSESQNSSKDTSNVKLSPLVGNGIANGHMEMSSAMPQEVKQEKHVNGYGALHAVDETNELRKPPGDTMENDSFSRKTPFRMTSSDNRAQSELRQSAEFWSHGNRIHEVSSTELVDHYHKDAELILKSLGRLEQVFHANDNFRPSSQIKQGGIERASVTLKANSPVSSVSARELLKASTLATQMSEAVSICDEEDLVPGLPKQSLRVLLSADPLFIGAKEDFEDGRMLTARKKLRTWCKRHGLSLAELKSHSKEIGLDVAQVEEHCNVIDKTLEAHSDEAGFRVARDDGELRVLYRTKNKGKYHCVKMEATLPFPLERPLSLAREFDLMKGWNKYISESELLYAPSIWESYVYAGLWMPFPFPQMECLGKGRGYDLSEEHRCLLIACESVENDELPEACKPLPKPKKKHHRAEIMPGSSIRLEPLPPLPGDAARTKGSILMIIDAHVPHVPEFIVNWVLGVMAPFAHKQIKKLLKNDYEDPTKPFPKRMAAQPELYDKVRNQVRLGLERHYSKRTVV